MTSLSLNLCKIELFSSKNHSKFSFFFTLFQDITLEKRLFFTSDHYFLQIGRIISEDSLTNLSLFNIIFSPKEYGSFMKKYQLLMDEEVFYDQDEFLYTKDFLQLKVQKSLITKAIISEILIKPFEYIFNYEVFTRIKYFLNPKAQIIEENPYNSFTKFNDFLNEGKEKAEEFFKEKLKSLLGHSLDLKLYLKSNDCSFVIPDSISREKTPIVLIVYDTFEVFTGEKEEEEYKLELICEAKNKPMVIEPECMNEDFWKMRVKLVNFAAKFITFHQGSSMLNVHSVINSIILEILLFHDHLYMNFL